MKKLAAFAGLVAGLLSVLVDPALGQDTCQWDVRIAHDEGTSRWRVFPKDDPVPATGNNSIDTANRAMQQFLRVIPRGDSVEVLYRVWYFCVDAAPPPPDTTSPSPPDTLPTPPAPPAPPDTTPAPEPEPGLPVASSLSTWLEGNGDVGLRWSGPAGTTWRVTVDGAVRTGPSGGTYWMELGTVPAGADICVRAVNGADLGDETCIIFGSAPPPAPPSPPPSPAPPPAPGPSPPPINGIGPGPNEPAGFVGFFSTDGSTKDFGSGFQYNPRWGDHTNATEPLSQSVAVTTLSDAQASGVPANPTGSGRVLVQEWLQGLGDGGVGAWSYLNQMVGPRRHVYLRYVFFIPTSWTTHRSGAEKLFRVYGQGGHFTFGLQNNRLSFALTFPGPGGAGCGSASYFSTVSAPKGQWIDYEAVVSTESAPGAKDGSIEAWANGTKVGSWNHAGCTSKPQSDGHGLDLGSSGTLGQLQFWPGMYWGGAGDRKTATERIYVGGYYLSAR